MIVEAGTFMVAAAMTNGDVSVEGIKPKQVTAVSKKLIDAGIQLDWYDTGVYA